MKTLQGCLLTTSIWNTALLCSSLEAPWTRLSSYLPTDGEPTSDDRLITRLCADRGSRVWMRLSVHCQGACPSASSSRIPHAFLGNHKQPADAASLSMAERAILHRKGGAQYRLGSATHFFPTLMHATGYQPFCAQTFVESGQMRLNVTQGRGV